MLVYFFNSLLFFIFASYFVYLILSSLREFDSRYSHKIVIVYIFILRAFHCAVLTSNWVIMLVYLALSNVMYFVIFNCWIWNVIMKVDIQNRRILTLLVIERGLLVMEFLLINVLVWYNFLSLRLNILIINNELKIFIF